MIVPTCTVSATKIIDRDYGASHNIEACMSECQSVEELLL